MKPPGTPNGTVRRHRSSSNSHQRTGGSPRPQVANASEHRLDQQTTLSGRLRKTGRPSRSTFRLQRPNSTDLIMHRSQTADLRRVRMEARWQIEAHDAARARHGGRAEKNNSGVDTVGLLMEARRVTRGAPTKVPGRTRRGTGASSRAPPTGAGRPRAQPDAHLGSISVAVWPILNEVKCP